MKSAPFVTVSHGSLVCRQYIIWTQMATFPLRYSYCVRVELSENRICEKFTAPWHVVWHMVWHVGQGVSHAYINKILSKIQWLSWLRTEGYFTGLVTVVGQFLLGCDAYSVGNGPRRFDGIYCRHLLGGMGPKGSVIRLPIDAASYSRRTESSAAPLRAPQNLRRLTGVKAAFF